MNILEENKGGKFELQFVPEETLRTQKDGDQDPLSESYAALMLGVANGSEIDMKNTINDFRIPLASVNDYAKM